MPRLRQTGPPEKSTELIGAVRQRLRLPRIERVGLEPTRYRDPDHFQGIVFRDGAAGRRPALVVEPDVWELVSFLRGIDERGPAAVSAAAEVFEALTDWVGADAEQAVECWLRVETDGCRMRDTS